MKYNFLFLSFFLVISVLGQDLTKNKLSFGLDEKSNIIIWQVWNLDSLKNKIRIDNKIAFHKEFNISEEEIEKLDYSSSIVISNKKKYTLYLTKSPIIHLSFDETKIKSEKKINGIFKFFNKGVSSVENIGIRHRGNISLTFPKKNFDLEFRKEEKSNESKNISFLGLRLDDDWILDALYNEPLRLRSYIATNLWSEIYKPYYIKEKPKAKSTFEVKFVEVFVNNEYQGIYQLSEQIDRKQLQIKKDKNKEMRGELYQAQSYKGGPEFKTSPKKYINLLGNWNGWQMEYPFINGESNWKNLSEFTNLVVNESDEKFKSKIGEKFFIKNAIDYYLFVNILGATDNLGKNYFIAKYDKNEPYFFIPWDLDGTWGVIQDGKEQYNTDKILDNGLLKRLIETNPNNYREKVKNRWFELRKSTFSNESLFQKIDAIYNRFSEEKIYEREFLIWKNKFTKIPKEKHYEHLKWWLEKKLKYLDNYYSKL